MCNLIIHKNGLKLENVLKKLIFKTQNQKKYILLKNIIDSVKGANLYIFIDGEK